MFVLIRRVGRTVRIVRVLGRYYLLPALPFWHGPRPGPVQLRLALEELGGTWIKLGQTLAMRFDLLPPAYCYELFKLLNEVQPFPYEQVREIIHAELGADPAELFRAFAPEPFAAASIGQVHHAMLPGGERVAVKVQRPRVRQIFTADIDLMYAFSGVLDRLGVFGATPSRHVIDEFARWTDDELDYRIEARHGRRLREDARGDPLQHVARVWQRYSTARVLTTELIEGIPLIDIMYARRDRDAAFLDRLAAEGYDVEAIVRHIDWNMFNQIHVFGYFHADLHPANLFVLPRNTIGYVDFGIVGRLSDEARDSLTRYTWLFFQRDTDRSIAELMRWVAPAPGSDVQAAQAELVQVHEDFLAALDGRTGEETPQGAGATFAVSILNVIRTHNLTLSASVMAYLKTLITADALRFELAPAYDLPAQVQRYFGRLQAQQFAAWRDPRHALSVAADYGFRVGRVLDAVDAQQRTVTAADTLLWEVQAQIDAARRRLRVFGILALVVGIVVMVALAFPGLRSDLSLSRTVERGVLWALIAAFVALILAMMLQGRRLQTATRTRGPSPDLRAAFLRRWSGPVD